LNIGMDKLYAEIGGRIRAVRQALKLTQAQVAEQAGIDASFYGQVERGANVPSLRTFLAIAAALRAEPADLLPSRKASQELDPALPKAMGQIIADLPAGKRHFLLGMLRDLAEELKK
jgi:transcriptional regulator with XRE-family HTH domain